MEYEFFFIVSPAPGAYRGWPHPRIPRSYQDGVLNSSFLIPSEQLIISELKNCGRGDGMGNKK